MQTNNPYKHDVRIMTNISAFIEAILSARSLLGGCVSMALCLLTVLDTWSDWLELITGLVSACRLGVGGAGEEEESTVVLRGLFRTRIIRFFLGLSLISSLGSFFTVTTPERRQGKEERGGGRGGRRREREEKGRRSQTEGGSGK